MTIRTIEKNGYKFLAREYCIGAVPFRRESGTKSFWDLYVGGSWEETTFGIFDKYLDKDHSYLDIGTWVGPTVLYGSQIAKHCYGVEPNPNVFHSLERNVKLNPELEKKITLFQLCIADKNGKVKFGNHTCADDSMSSLVFADRKHQWEVDALTLETFIETNKINDYNFIKMDIEAGEAIVIPNSKDYFQKNQPNFHLSLHPRWFPDREKNAQEIVDALSQYNNVYENVGTKHDLNWLLAVMKIKKTFDVVLTK